MTGRLRAVALGGTLWALASGPAGAVQPDEIMADRGLEVRARHISAALRCVVCQNQSIDDSDAPLARDLRLLVRERLAAGDSDDAVGAFVSARYGAFVLLKPPLGIATALLWFGPPAVALAAAAALFAARRRRPSGADVPPLSAEEARRLDALIGRGDR